jgi:D-arabinose 1-dehydrogenase-like Zn-dependent alcohol dehydrogenase
MGVDFFSPSKNSKTTLQGPDLLKILRSLPRTALPEDIRKECFDRIFEGERAKRGDWMVIWGGSSATGCIAVQLAKLAGLRVLAVLDVARSGERMLRYGADILVDRYDMVRAAAVVKGITANGQLRFALDTIGKESAGILAQILKNSGNEGGRKGHLIGLTGLPKEPTEGVVYHTVPIKTFHEVPAVGEGMMVWLESLLRLNLLGTPDVEVAEGGLKGINAALDRLRKGVVNGPRIVVPLNQESI